MTSTLFTPDADFAAAAAELLMPDADFVVIAVADLLERDSIVGDFFKTAGPVAQNKIYDERSWTEGGWESAAALRARDGNRFGAPVAWWGNQMFDAEVQMLKNETPAERARRFAQEDAEDLKRYNGIVKFSINKKADKWCGQGGKMKFRVPTPCKYASLFAQRICAGSMGKECGKKVPEGQTKCSCGQALAGCWSHEEKRSCIYVHPEEKQGEIDLWPAAISGDLCFDRKRELFHLRTSPLAAENRFEQLARNAREEPAPKKRSSGSASRFGPPAGN